MFGSALFELKWSTVFYPLRVRTVHPTPKWIFSLLCFVVVVIVIVCCRRCCCRRCPSRSYVHNTCEQGRHRLRAAHVNWHKQRMRFPRRVTCKRTRVLCIFDFYWLETFLSSLFFLLEEKRTFDTNEKSIIWLEFFFLISFWNKCLVRNKKWLYLSLSTPLPRSISEFNKFFIMPSWSYRRAHCYIANVFGANKNLLPVLLCTQNIR